jgi:F-type H+-transporting ATPase subunit epsilon
MVSQGFIEVRDNHVRILADEAIPGSEIDVSKAEQDLREAQEQMAHPAPDADIEALLIRYRNATARIETARQAKG